MVTISQQLCTEQSSSVFLLPNKTYSTARVKCFLALSIFYGAACFPKPVVTLPRCLPKTHAWPVIKSSLLLPGNYYAEINSTLQFNLLHDLTQGYFVVFLS